VVAIPDENEVPGKIFQQSNSLEKCLKPFDTRDASHEPKNDSIIGNTQLAPKTVCRWIWKMDVGIDTPRQ
jgi:hypothetical protein